MSDKKDPNASFQPIPSLGHELGILFGFAGLMFLCMVGYWIGWGCESFQKDLVLSTLIFPAMETKFFVLRLVLNKFQG